MEQIPFILVIFLFSWTLYITILVDLCEEIEKEGQQGTTSPVHVVLVSLLVNQLSGLFLTFLVDQKKFVQSQGIFGQSLNFFWSGSDFLVY